METAVVDPIRRPVAASWKVKGISAMTYNANFQSVPTNNTGPNSWKHAYFEGYMQYNINNSSPTGWPAFWSWPDGNSGVEVDFMEVAGPNETPKAAVWSGWTIHDPAGEQGSAVKANGAMQNPVDSNWHTYACWWRIRVLTRVRWTSILITPMSADRSRPDPAIRFQTWNPQPVSS